ncbi:MAG TPA: hypothetical protein V6C72_02530 [Chroococcales cyanobacterium]
MHDFETAEDENEQCEHDSDASCEGRSWKIGSAINSVAKRIILFVSLGPGVLGLLWLLGRILRR